MSKKKVLRVILIGLGLVLLMLFILQSYIHRQIDELVKEKITEILGEGYKAEYRKSNIGFIKKSITLKGIEVSKSHDTLKLWSSKIVEVEIHGFQALKFLKGEGIKIDSITIDKPEFKLLAYDKDTTHTTIHSDTLNRKSDTELAISIIRINNGLFHLDPEGPENLMFNINLLLKDLSLSEIKKKQLELLDHIDLSIENFSYQFPDSVYSIHAESIKAMGYETSFNVMNIDVQSNLSKKDYPKHFGWQKVLFDINVPSVNIGRPSFLNQDSLIIPKITIDGIEANLSKDKNYPLPNRHTELPQYMLARMGLKLRCDSILISNGQLHFEAIQPSGEAAQVKLAEIGAAIVGLQNIDSLLPAFTLIAQSKLQEEAHLEMKTVYSYGPLNPFTLKGSIGNTRLEFMDEFLMKMIGLKIEAGSLNKLYFEMNGNTYGESGFVDFYYDSLEIHAVDKETGNDKKVVNFISNVVGGLVFWHENPSKDQFRRGTFNVERDVRKGFVSQWMDGLLYGIMDSVSKVDPGKVKQTSNSIKERFHKNGKDKKKKK